MKELHLGNNHDTAVEEVHRGQRSAINLAGVRHEDVVRGQEIATPGYLVPARGAIEWPEMIRNQFEVVPRQLASNLRSYFFRRKAMMQEIERRDIEQLHPRGPGGNP